MAATGGGGDNNWLPKQESIAQTTPHAFKRDPGRVQMDACLIGSHLLLANKAALAELHLHATHSVRNRQSSLLTDWLTEEHCAD